MFKSLYTILFIIIGLGYTSFAQEICDNGIDDDQDQLIDFNDPDCDCVPDQIPSMIRNPSFEDYHCCPNDLAQMTCANRWIQASRGTTDYMNLCGWWDEGVTPPPFPLPDGEAVVRFIDGHTGVDDRVKKPYKEYVGACLEFPMSKDSVYQLNLQLGFKSKDVSPDLKLSIFGTSSCTKLPFGTRESVDCPSNYGSWFLLDSQSVKNQPNSWVEVSLTIDPDVDVRAIAIGPSCNTQRAHEKTYYFIDNLVLYEITRTTSDFSLLDRGAQCNPNFVFAIKHKNQNAYQWYKNGIALVGEQNNELSQMYGEGTYQVTITNRDGCKISPEFDYHIPKLESSSLLRLCQGQPYQLGDTLITTPGNYTRLVTTKDGCDSLVLVDVRFGKPFLDSVDVRVGMNQNPPSFLGTVAKPGFYTKQMTSLFGCDSTIVYNLEFEGLFVPSTITPNQDGINDQLKLLGSSFELESHQFTIYNRWGNKIYQGEHWDGKTGLSEPGQGVFLYFLEAKTTDGQVKSKSGTVLLLANSN